MKLAQSIGIVCLLVISSLITGCGNEDVTLSSITVTHPNATVSENTTEQFTATGKYSDGSTKDLTSSATLTWSSDNTAVTFNTSTKGEATIGDFTSDTTVNITATTTVDNRTLSGTAQLSVTATSGNPTTATITIGSNAQTACDSAYSPNSTAIAVGGTVTWINNDTIQHTVESTNDTFSSACPPDGTEITTGELNISLNSGSQTQHIFNTAGTYRYVCGLLGHQMRGTVIVQ